MKHFALTKKKYILRPILLTRQEYKYRFNHLVIKFSSSFKTSNIMVRHILTTKYFDKPFTSASSSSTFWTILRISFGVSLPAIFLRIREIKVCSSSPICSMDFCTSQGLSFFSIKLERSKSSQLILKAKRSSLRFGIR